MKKVEVSLLGLGHLALKGLGFTCENMEVISTNSTGTKVFVSSEGYSLFTELGNESKEFKVPAQCSWVGLLTSKVYVSVPDTITSPSVVLAKDVILGEGVAAYVLPDFDTLGRDTKEDAVCLVVCSRDEKARRVTKLPGGLVMVEGDLSNTIVGSIQSKKYKGYYIPCVAQEKNTIWIEDLNLLRTEQHEL